MEDFERGKWGRDKKIETEETREWGRRALYAKKVILIEGEYGGEKEEKMQIGVVNEENEGFERGKQGSDKKKKRQKKQESGEGEDCMKNREYVILTEGNMAEKKKKKKAIGLTDEENEGFCERKMRER